MLGNVIPTHPAVDLAPVVVDDEFLLPPERVLVLPGRMLGKGRFAQVSVGFLLTPATLEEASHSESIESGDLQG